MSEPFMGIQMGSHTVFDEDLEKMLDVLQETAGINVVIPYATTYADVMRGRLPGALAPDHGVTAKDPRTRNTTRVWFAAPRAVLRRHVPAPRRRPRAGRARRPGRLCALDRAACGAGE